MFFWNFVEIMRIKMIILKLNFLKFFVNNEDRRYLIYDRILTYKYDV